MMAGDRDGGSWGRGSHQLKVIAETLGIPVEALFGNGGAGAAADRLSELLRLWSAIRDEAGHEAVLVRAREVVAAQPETDPA